MHTVRPLALLSCLTVACTMAAAPGGGPDAVGHQRNDAGPASADGGTQVDAALTLISERACTNPCTFQAGGGLSPDRVVYRADGWVIGESDDPADRYAISYAFQTTGERHIVAQAYDRRGNLMSAASAWINVRPGEGEEEEVPARLPDVPYFYQYANSLYPNSTCQNTTIAMVLAMRGWSGTPDVITEFWGKDRAQSPEGFSEVLNGEASYWGVDVRSTHRRDATFEDLHSLLDQGIPVPVHGYFTGYGHVLLVLGYDANGYWVNDPAGEWNERFTGGYPYGWDSTVGDGIYYPRAAFEAAIGTSNGSTPLPIWLHELSF